MTPEGELAVASAATEDRNRVVSGGLSNDGRNSLAPFGYRSHCLLYAHSLGSFPHWAQWCDGPADAMTDTTNFQASDGTVVWAEVDDAPDRDPYEPIARPRPDRAADTAETLRQAVDRVRPAAQDVLDSLRAMPQSPDRVAMEFGVKLSAEAGVVLARAASEGHFKILLEWERQPDARNRGAEPGDADCTESRAAPVATTPSVGTQDAGTQAVAVQDAAASDDAAEPDTAAPGTSGHEGGL
ncbi:CU044_2847 family protein [Streptomyces sp. NPDC048290]|uniref:CU044_2847 family protein n=1 Tax=Streptomyces sp. NPDC048290 TaxID=3155811 RepID=UPI003418BB43